ncbi:MAG: hypothetical protein ACYCUZ_05425 [Cuniculiplasma sp.]
MKKINEIVKNSIVKIAELSKDRRMLVMAIVFIVAFSGGFTILLDHAGNSGNTRYVPPESPPGGSSPPQGGTVTPDTGLTVTITGTHPGISSSPNVLAGEPINLSLTVTSLPQGWHVSSVNWTVCFQYSPYAGAIPPNETFNTNTNTQLSINSTYWMPFDFVEYNTSANIGPPLLIPGLGKEAINKSSPMHVFANVEFVYNGLITGKYSSNKLLYDVFPPPLNYLSLSSSPSFTLSGVVYPKINASTDVGHSFTFYNTFERIAAANVTTSLSWDVKGGSYSMVAGPSGSFGGFPYTSETITFNNVGNYTVSANCSTTVGGYTFSDGGEPLRTAAVHSDPPPAVSISPTHNPADIGVPVQFNTTTTGGTGKYTYNYTLYDGQSSSSSILLTGNSSNFSYTFFSQGNYLLSWKITSNNFSGSSSIIESVNLDPTVSLSENKTTTDAGNPIAFTSSVQGGSTPHYYTWYERSSNASSYSIFSSNASPSHSFNAAGTYFVYLSLRDGSAYVVNSSIVAITVNPPLSGSITLSPSVLPVSNSTDVGSVSLSGGSGVSQNNICWTNGFFQALGSPTEPCSFSAGTHLIAVTITDNAGSVLKLHTYLRVLQNNILIVPHVPSQVPQNSVISLSAHAYSFIGPNVTVTGYSWSINDGTFGGQSITYNFNLSGTYHVFITAWGSYKGKNDTNTSEVNITSLPPSSTPNIVIMPLETNVSGGIDFSYWVTFHNNTSFSAAFITVGGATYQPSNMSMFSNGTVHISKSVRFSTLQEGSYSMNLQVINNQSQQKDSNITFSVSLQQSGTFSIYSIANFFGGYYNFLAFVATIASLVIAYVGLQSDKRPPVININENGKNVEYQLSGKRVGKR